MTPCPRCGGTQGVVLRVSIGRKYVRTAYRCTGIWEGANKPYPCRWLVVETKPRAAHAPPAKT